MKFIERILLVAGLVAIPVLVASVGSGETARQIELLGWWLAGIVALGFVPHFCDTMGLFMALPIDRAKVGLGYTFAARLAGEGVNAILPTATVGGELLKVLLLGRRAPLDQVTAGVSLTYSIDAFSVMVLTGMTMPLLVSRVPLPIWHQRAFAVLVLLGLLGTYVFMGIIRRGLLARLVATLRLVGSDLSQAAWAKPVAVGSRAVETSLLFLMAAALWQTVEIVLVCRALGVRADLLECFTIASLSSFLDAVFFFVPGQIGTREGGLVGITVLAGLGAPLGMTIGLVERLRQIVWAIVGYAFFLALTENGTPEPAETPTAVRERTEPRTPQAQARPGILRVLRRPFPRLRRASPTHSRS